MWLHLIIFLSSLVLKSIYLSHYFVTMDTVIHVSGEYSLSQPEAYLDAKCGSFSSKISKWKVITFDEKISLSFAFQRTPSDTKQTPQYRGHHGWRRLCWQVLFRCVEHIRLFIYSLSRHYKHLVQTECLPDACFSKVCAGSGPNFLFKLCDCQSEDTRVNNNLI